VGVLIEEISECHLQFIKMHSILRPMHFGLRRTQKLFLSLSLSTKTFSSFSFLKKLFFLCFEAHFCENFSFFFKFLSLGAGLFALLGVKQVE
jgi:hypothetical protein